MPSLDITFCGDSAKCKKRHTCFRHTGVELQHVEGCYWYSDFLAETKESGRECKHYISTEK